MKWEEERLIPRGPSLKCSGYLRLETWALQVPWKPHWLLVPAAHFRGVISIGLECAHRAFPRSGSLWSQIWSKS
uniref:Uncharacterized protein n=1 Tax=Parascaris equorum TaxID=6256 RepID=A0A914RPI7_PAREQ